MTTVGQILKAIDCACKLICFPCRVVSIACIYVCKLLKAVVKYTWRAVRKVLKYSRLALYKAVWFVACCPCIFARWLKSVSESCHKCIDPYYSTHDHEQLVRHPTFYFIVRWLLQHSESLFTFLLLIVGNGMVVHGMGRAIEDFGAAFESGTPYIGWVGNITLDLRNSTEFLKEYVEEVTDLDDEILAVSQGLFNATDEQCLEMSNFYDEMHGVLENVAAFCFAKTAQPLEVIGTIVEACHEFEETIDPVLFTSAYMSVPNQLCDGADYVLQKLKWTTGVIENNTGVALTMLEQGDTCEQVSDFLRESPIRDYFEKAEDALDFATKEVLDIIDQMQVYLNLVSVSASSTGNAVEVSADLDFFYYLSILFVACQLVSGVVLFGPAISQEAKPQGKPRATIKLVSGTGLAAKDIGKDGKPNSSDPYVIVSSGRHILKTKFRQKTTEPVFNTVFNWSIDDDDETVAVRVFDYDFMASDDFMGEVVFNIDELQYLEDAEEKDYELQRSPLYPGEFVKGTIKLLIYKREAFRWCTCCGKACVSNATEEQVDLCIRGCTSKVFRTLQKSTFHWFGFLLNITLLGFYIGFFVASLLLIVLPWQAFCDAGQDGLGQVFKLVEMIVDKGTVLANELLQVGTISTTLGLLEPRFACKFLGDEDHFRGNKVLLVGLFLCVLGRTFNRNSSPGTRR